MKNAFLTIALTLICLPGLGIAARAQDVDKIAANVPFEFIAGGKTLPAGTYSVRQVSPEANSVILIRSNDDSVFVIPMFADRDAASITVDSADQASLGFEHVGDKYFLSQIETIGGVYALKTPRTMNQVAQRKDHGSGSTSGSSSLSGSN